MAYARQVRGKGETVRRSLALSALVLLIVLGTGFAQEQATEPTPAGTTVTVSAPKAECSGFIASESIPRNLVLYDGADNDHHQPLRQFAAGDYVYLRIGGGTSVTEGSEYRIVRRASELYRNQWYSGQQWDGPLLGAALRSRGTREGVPGHSKRGGGRGHFFLRADLPR